MTNGVAVRMALLYLLAGTRPEAGVMSAEPGVGEVVEDRSIRGWIVDPAAGREGAGEVVLRDGVLEAVHWLDGADADGLGPDGVVDLARVRRPACALPRAGQRGRRDDGDRPRGGRARRLHDGLPHAQHDARDRRAVGGGAIRSGPAASGSPVRALIHGAVTAGRAGGDPRRARGAGRRRRRRVLRRRVAGPLSSILGHALAYAGALGLPIVDHPEDPSLTEGAEAGEGYVATVLGLRGWPGSAEAGSVARSIAILADVIRDVPGARLHLTHVSTAASLAHVRAAKAAGLPVTCDVTPHHLALTDGWIAGVRRWAWESLDADGRALDPWAGGSIVAAPFDTSLRVNPPLRPAEDAAAVLAALLDGTADAIATDHAPHTEVDKHVEFGWAAKASAASRRRSASCWRRSMPGSCHWHGRSLR